MPTFGEFETVGQPYAVSDVRSHVSTIWQARKTGAGGEPLYVVKCYAPRGRAASPGQPEEALAHDRRLEFLEGIKQIKKAQSEGGRGLAPIYALGTTDTEAWYVTDFYPRKDLQAWIDRKGEVNGAALRHVVFSVVTACLALKRSRGCTHGNLKPSNIFLAGKPRDLRKTPLLLTDAYPAAPLQLARLEADDRHEAGELLHQVMEAQDLAALGQLILQLVEGRLLSRSDDYNYPVERSPAWDAVGKDGDYWLQWCNKLLNPQLSLETINLETLATEFKPIKSPLPLIAGVIVGVCVLVLGSYFAVKGWQQWREGKYQSVVQAARQALSTTNLVAAREQVERARKLRPEDPGAITLEAQIQEQIDRSYTAAIQAATTASSNGNHRETTNQAGIALSFKPGDPAARNWMSNGQKGIENEASEAQRAANCSHAKTGAREAESQPNWPLALEYWQRAQRFCTNEPAIANDIAFVTAMATAHALLGQAQTKTTSAPEAATNLCAQALKALPAQVLYAGNSERTTAAGALKVEVDKARAAAEALAAQNEEKIDLGNAQSYFKQGEYDKSIQLCNSHRLPVFDSLAESNRTERAAFNGANTNFSAGNYSFIEQLRSQSYSSKKPFHELLTKADAESNALSELKALKQATNWNAVEARLMDSASRDFASKTPFAELLKWAQDERTKYKAAAALEIDKCKLEFAILAKELNVTLPKELRHPGASTARVYGEDVMPTATKASYSNRVDRLEKSCKEYGLLSEKRPEYLNKMRVSVKNW